MRSSPRRYAVALGNVRYTPRIPPKRTTSVTTVSGVHRMQHSLPGRVHSSHPSSTFIPCGTAAASPLSSIPATGYAQ